jgi:hypothetical protein
MSDTKEFTLIDQAGNTLKAPIVDDTKQGLQRIQTAPPAPMFGGVNIEALLSKAVDANSAVDVLERLAVMRREMKAEQAKEAFDHAMAEFQAECPVINKGKQVKGGKFAYNYAPLDAIVSETKELLRRHGFSYTLTAKVEEKWVTAIVRVKHSAGHAEESEFKVPIDPDSYMNAPQKFASALTFAKRYAFCNSFGILTGDVDDDAHGADPDNAAGQGRRPAPAQMPPTPRAQPRPATQAPAPAPAKEKAPTRTVFPTAKFREAAIKALKADAEPLRKFVTEFLQKAGVLMPNNTIDEWPLRYVPATPEELAQVLKAIQAFEAGEEAKFPFQHQEPGDPPKPKPAAAKPIEVPRAPDAGDQSTAPTEIDPDWDKVGGTIDRTSYKNGTKRTGEAWEMWGIKIGQDWFNTFSSRLGKLAEANKGREVDLYYSANERGKTAEHIEV